ncbi:MAG: molybdopterin molybdenumtransferase MoeA, partial [Burkholderiaceae bacterium]
MKPGLLSFDEALAALLAHAGALTDTEAVDTAAADGRVLAEDIRSALDVPPRDNTQMDGYAVRAADLVAAASERPLRLPVAQRIPAGHVGQALAAGTVARIFTGALIPDGADAVVMQEAVQLDGETALFSAPAQPGEWIRRRGEDIAAGSVILPAG